jgi:hypothetical protein
MPLLKPITEMNEADLRFHYDWNRDFASMFQSKREESMARGFHGLAMRYAQEMDKRGIDYQRPPKAITQADIDRAIAASKTPAQVDSELEGWTDDPLPPAPP